MNFWYRFLVNAIGNSSTPATTYATDRAVRTSSSEGDRRGLVPQISRGRDGIRGDVTDPDRCIKDTDVNGQTPVPAG